MARPTDQALVSDQAEERLDPPGFDPSRIAKGDRLWFAPSNKFRMTGWLEVTKIGRKWAQLSGVDGNRFDGRVEIGKRDLDGGGYSSPGSLYASPEEREHKVSLDRRWGDFKRIVSETYRRPAHLDADGLAHLISLINPGAAK